MGKIAFLFAGQGAQSVGMGRDLYDAVPAAREVYDMGESLRPGTLATCFEGPAEALGQTENTQPCLFLTDLACAKALTAAGVTPDAVAGFSLGEVPALGFAGALTEEDAFRLVCLRGETMAKCAEEHPGGMAAVLKLPEETVEKLASEFEEVWCVNYNCPGQISCAGKTESIAPFCDAVKAAGGRAVPLAVSGAFHTPYMKKTSDVLRARLDEMDVCAPKTPVYANLTGDLYPADICGVKDTLSRQVSSGVRWETAIRNLYAAGFDTFIEVGAGKTLQGLVKKTLEGVTILGVSDVASLEATLAALGK